MNEAIAVINAGSSSIKFALYEDVDSLFHVVVKNAKFVPAEIGH